MAPPAISFQKLSYRYRGQARPALDDLTLDIAPGEFVAIMGPSDAGKSTFAVTLNGLIPHFHKGRFEGDVVVHGRNTRRRTVAEMAAQVGTVFQDFEAQLFSTDVSLEVAFGPANFGVPRDEIVRRVEENLQAVGLEAFRGRPPATLSGGQKQKLAIASVLSMHPSVLVMDEPTTDLDPISKTAVYSIVNQLRQRREVTLLVAEHETEETLCADRLLLLKEGRLVAYGAAADLLRRVDLMEDLGLMPLGVPKYFQRMGLDDAPLTPEAGTRRFRMNGWQLDEARADELAAADRQRAQRGGAPLIRCRGLEHRYANGVMALRGVDLDIHAGEVLAIVGQNGSGKTTLAKHLNGLLQPTSGWVEVDGKPAKGQSVYQLGKQVGYVFQNPDHQIFSETVFDEVAFSPRLRQMDAATIRQRVSEALQAVELSGLEQADPFSLAKGARQRVAVASVLAAHPPVVILDEPTTGLDYVQQRGLMDMVRRLNENGCTIVFVTHHMWVVAEYAHRVVVMKDGGILLQGTPREVFAQEATLREAHLCPPQIVSLSNRLGRTLLTVDEMEYCTRLENPNGQRVLP